MEFGSICCGQHRHHKLDVFGGSQFTAHQFQGHLYQRYAGRDGIAGEMGFVNGAFRKQANRGLSFSARDNGV